MALLAVVASAALGAAPAGAAVSLLQVGTFAQPVYVTAPAGDASRIFVVQKTGKIVVVGDGVSSTFLDITSRVRSSGSEQGLLSVAFAPDYATSGTFYVYYTAQPPGGSGAPGSDLTVSAFQRTDADHADPGSERVVLQIPHRKFDNHNGGNLQFGPDGMLWVGTGDGGDGNDSLGNAQQTSPTFNDADAGHDARLGKLLRIDPRPGPGCDGRCTIPAGNPGFAQPEIWAKGLRNPWRFSFDRATGDLVIGDVGQATWEEVDFAAAPGRGAGADYGWNIYEGLHPRGSTAPAGAPAGVTMPVLEKAHAAPDSFASIAGGYVVRDPALPELFGRYVYADTFLGDIRAATLAAGGATGDAGTGLHVSTLASFGEDACGRVYAVSLEGPVYRLAQSGDCVLPPSVGGPGVTPPVTPGAPGGRAGAGGPGVKLSAAARQRPWRTGVVGLRVSCEQICDITARGAFLISKANKNAGAAAVVKLLRTSSVKTTLAAGATVSLKAKVSATTRRSLLRALQRGRRITLRFAVTATDRAGRTKTTSARSRITRR
ncbi:MAG: PQQ-dependent sugar dehydrogenase [Baekduia sp.]